MEKEMKIIPPVGYEIDVENSTFDCIKFKPMKQELTYKNVCVKVFKENKCYYISGNGTINCIDANAVSCTDANEAPTKEQLEKILAINQLQNIANYYNGDWKPNWNDIDKSKYAIYFNNETYAYNPYCYISDNIGMPVFKNKEDAQAVIDNLNFREILDKIYKS